MLYSLLTIVTLPCEFCSPDSPFYRSSSDTPFAQLPATALSGEHSVTDKIPKKMYQPDSPEMVDMMAPSLDGPSMEMQHSSQYVPFMLHRSDAFAGQLDPESPTSVYAVAPG